MSNTIEFSRLPHVRGTSLFAAVCTPLFLLSSGPAAAHSLLIEAEGFDRLGGWVVDQQFMDQMGSPFLLAHGLGVPVADASTTIHVPHEGTYRVFVRTRDWVAPWKAPGAPGRFQLLVNSRPLDTTFGIQGVEWHWQDGGSVSLKAGKATVALHDLSGFEGRCDAVVLSAEPGFVPPSAGPALAAFRRKALCLSEKPSDAGTFDLVVAGGGVAGTCAAISGARLGLKVALIQDRPVLGGNNSSEIRVGARQSTNLEPFPRIGDLVTEVAPFRPGAPLKIPASWDDHKLHLLRAEPNIQLFLNTRVAAVEKNGDCIGAVIARNVASSKELRFPARVFADCTGDGNLGFLAGADYRYGREGRAETTEPMAPEKGDRQVLGSTVLWTSAKSEQPTAFPRCPWALQFTEATCQRATVGEWNWEGDFRRHTIDEAELIRDYFFRAIYGNWAFQKNDFTGKERYANLRLDWVAYVAGKRESRRLLGDVILTEHDIRQQRQFPDACLVSPWHIDLHMADPKNEAAFPEGAFRSLGSSVAGDHRTRPHLVPLRCLFSRNVANLMMAGRCISVTHVAHGTIRVQRTGGMMGEVVGMAASLCVKHSTTPRGVYQHHLEEFKGLLQRGVGKRAAAP
jgi:hypothetical protein